MRHTKAVLLPLTSFAIFVGCDDSPKSTSIDRESPVVQITTPSAASVVNVGTLLVQGAATDNVRVLAVDVRMDEGAFVRASLDNNLSRTAVWDTLIEVPVGTHRITARATDSAGNEGISSLDITARSATSSGDAGPSLDGSIAEDADANAGSGFAVYDKFDAPLYTLTTDGAQTPNGLWALAYVSEGSVKTIRDTANPDNAYLVMSPKLDALRAARIDTTGTWNGIHGRLRARLDAQLRPAETWYTIWPLIAYVDDTTHFYFNLKTNGWELGKKDNDHPPVEELQEYLATGVDPKAVIGQWYTIEWWIVKEPNVANMRLRVDVDGVQVVNMLDNQPWQRNGTTGSGTSSYFLNASKRVALYSEASRVSWDDVYISEQHSPP